MKKRLFYILLAGFIFYSLYKFVLIYVLNISSPKTHYSYHSESIQKSKKNGLYVASFQLDKNRSHFRFSDTLIPKEIFIEKEKVIYPNYYFYWGKSEISNRLTLNCNTFLDLTKTIKYDITCPLSTQPYEKENIDKYRGNVFFFFTSLPVEIYFLVYYDDNQSKPDSLIYKKLEQ